MGWKEDLVSICRRGKAGRFILFSQFINVIKRSSGIMPLRERTLCGKYSMLKNQVRLATLFCLSLLGVLYCLDVIFKQFHFHWVFYREWNTGRLPPSFRVRRFSARLLAAEHSQWGISGVTVYDLGFWVVQFEYQVMGGKSGELWHGVHLPDALVWSELVACCCRGYYFLLFFGYVFSLINGIWPNQTECNIWRCRIH